MRDLEIRGAGNLLGDEQSGHVAALGFELYLSMLDEAVAAAEGLAADDEPEPVRLDVSVDAYVPADYVPYEQAKVDVHRRIAGAREVADLARAARRARGPLRPGARAARNLIALQQARIKLGRAGARAVCCAATRSPSRRWISTPSSRRAARGLPEARYEPGRARCRCASRSEPPERFAAVVAAADALLAVTARPVPEPAAA